MVGRRRPAAAAGGGLILGDRQAAQGHAGIKTIWCVRAAIQDDRWIAQTARACWGGGRACVKTREIGTDLDLRFFCVKIRICRSLSIIDSICLLLYTSIVARLPSFSSQPSPWLQPSTMRTRSGDELWNNNQSCPTMLAVIPPRVNKNPKNNKNNR
jgi:hypothetical protein